MLTISLTLIASACTFSELPQAVAGVQPSVGPGGQQVELDSERCRSRGIVRVTKGQLPCDYLIILEDGSLVTPINQQDLPKDFRQRERIQFTYEVIASGDRACNNADYVVVSCITRISPDLEQHYNDQPWAAFE